MKREGSYQLKLGAVLSYAGIFLQNIINIVYTPIMLRYLGQAEYGLYVLIGSLIGYIAVMDFGLGNTISRYIAKFRVEQDRTKESNLVAMCLIMYSGISLLAIVVGAILYGQLGVVFKNGLTISELDEAKIMFAILIFNVAISFPLNTFNAILIGYEKFVVSNSFSLIRIILVPCFVVPMLLLGYNAVSVVVINTIFNILVGIMNVLYVLIKLRVKIRIYYFDKAFVKELTRYSIFVFIGVIVDQIYWRTGQIILGVYKSTIVVSVYAIAMQICTYYMTLSTTISGVFLPRVTQMVAQNTSDQEITKLFTRTGRLQFIILGCILGGFILFGKQFLILWAGPQYADAWLLILIIIIPLTVPLIQTVGISVLQAKNMHAFRSVTYLCVAIANLGLSVVLVPQMVGLGAALSTALSLIIGNIIIINVYYHKKVGINVIAFFRSILTLLPVAGIAWLISSVGLLMTENSWISLLLKGSIYIITYILAMWFIGFNDDEKQLLTRPLASFKKAKRVNVPERV
ncbi:oligosaccharide flippase family protein [Paenibacillus sp. GCM10027628]|uniref:oligosaccharide flippase family protein n=1 Tax=Paenibacillus sp. GCM10027628 TaxID=3273413 RepID=UPI00363C501E